MDDFINREAARLAMTALKQEDIEAFGMVIPECFPSASAIEAINKIPSAEVVSRDCYNRILAENDAMREMLAQIGKKPGDKMDDVLVAARSEWIINDVGDNTLYAKCKHCLITQVLYGGKQPTNFCPNCGADMTTKTGR